MPIALPCGSSTPGFRTHMHARFHRSCRRRDRLILRYSGRPGPDNNAPAGASCEADVLPRRLFAAAMPAKRKPAGDRVRRAPATRSARSTRCRSRRCETASPPSPARPAARACCREAAARRSNRRDRVAAPAMRETPASPVRGAGCRDRRHRRRRSATAPPSAGEPRCARPPAWRSQNPSRSSAMIRLKVR